MKSVNIKNNDDNLKFFMVRSMNMIVMYYRTVSQNYLNHAKLWDHKHLSQKHGGVVLN